MTAPFPEEIPSPQPRTKQVSGLGTDQGRFLPQTSLQTPKFLGLLQASSYPKLHPGPGCGAPSLGAISRCNELEIIAASGTQLTPSWPDPAGAFASQKSSFSPRFLRKLPSLFLPKVSLLNHSPTSKVGSLLRGDDLDLGYIWNVSFISGI